MKRMLIAVLTVLVATACGDGSSSPLEPGTRTTPDRPSFTSSGYSTIFTTQTPAETLIIPDTTAGWEVGTQFYVTREVCIAELRFWRAVGESGTNRVRLWRVSTGQQITSRIIYATGSGWKSEYFSSIVCLEPYVYYRISVNTNKAQVKTFGAFANGPIVNGPFVATSGYYGQPTGSMPTTASSSNFFVDLVVFD